MSWWSRVRWRNASVALAVVAAAALAVWPRAAAEPIVPPSAIEQLPSRPVRSPSRTETTAAAPARPRARRESSQSPRPRRRPRIVASSRRTVVPATPPEPTEPRVASPPATARDGDEFGLR